jgi:hypothetical protein
VARRADQFPGSNQLFELFNNWSTPEIDRWGGKFRLKWVELAVRGIRDDIGHPDGMTRYRVESD